MDDYKISDNFQGVEGGKMKKTIAIALFLAAVAIVNLGGDIMIHGKAVTIGCVPVGDDAIEDIFYLAYAVGIRNVSVIIAPYDMRNGRKPELERSPLKWYPDLCREIDIALCGSAKLYGLDDTSLME